MVRVIFTSLMTQDDLYGCPPVTKCDLSTLLNSKYFETKDTVKDEQAFFFLTVFRHIFEMAMKWLEREVPFVNFTFPH